MTNLKSVYILVNGTEFIGNDHSSGGYPYSTTNITGAYKADEPSTLLHWFGDTGANMYPKAKVARLEYVITDVDQGEIKESARKAALAKLTAKERELLGL